MPCFNGSWSFRSILVGTVGMGAGVFAAACSAGEASTASSSSGEESALGRDAAPSRDAGGGGALDSASPIADASLGFDAASLPPALQQCAACMEQTCAPQVAACEADPDCKDLLVCTLESGCLNSTNPSACISTCGVDAGLTTKEILEATKLLEQMITSCASCIDACPNVDGG